MTGSMYLGFINTYLSHHVLSISSIQNHPLLCKRWRSSKRFLRFGTIRTACISSPRMTTAASPPAQSSKLLGSTESNQGKLIVQAREILNGLGRLAEPFWMGATRRTAWIWTVLTLFLAIAATAHVTVSSIIQKLFFNILQQKDWSAFGRFMISYVTVVILRPFVLAFYDWSKARLSLRWRDVLTTKFLNEYFMRMNYYRLTTGEIDNPDQRISEDIRAFTVKAVTLLCQCFTAAIEFLIFSVLLYKVYPPLYPTLVLYTAVGTVVTVIAGRRLFSLNRQQVAREADYRFDLVRCRENAESIAFYSGENGESRGLRSRFLRAFKNNMRLVDLQRNVGILTTGHRSIVQILPCLVSARPYFTGAITFGDIYMTFFAFNHVLQSTGLVVQEFAAISELGAGLSRLSELDSQMLRKDSKQEEKITRTLKEHSGISIDNLSIVTPSSPPRSLVERLRFNVARGKRLLVTGESGVGKSSLLRCIAGLWADGSGHLTIPPAEETLFLPQRPYLTLGTLRENVAYPLSPNDVTDSEIETALLRVNLPSVIERMGGLDESGERLGQILSLGEQQRLAFARIVLFNPTTCILDESTSALDADNESAMYQIIQEMNVTCISVGNRPSIIKYHDEVLKLYADGTWDLDTVADNVKAKKQETFKDTR